MSRIFDFSQLGGLPWYQDSYANMQEAYRVPLRALAELGGTNPHIISGIKNTGGTVSDGVLYYDGEIIPFIGGAVAETIKITTYNTTYVYENGDSHIALTRKEASFGTGAVQFNYADLKLFQETFGDNGRTEWIIVSDTANIKLEYCINRLTKMCNIRGSWSRASTALVDDPPHLISMIDYPEEIWPIKQVYFQSTVINSFENVTDINGAVIKGEDCTIYPNANGLAMCWRKRPDDAGYTQRFDFSYPLY